MAEYPKWIGTDPDDPTKGVTVHSAEEEGALTGIDPNPTQDIFDLSNEDEAPKPKPKK